MSNDIQFITAEPEAPVMWHPGSAIDPARLEFLWKLAERIASSALVPMSLRGKGREGQPGWEPFSDAKVVANVFAVVEQADRWGSSPFALLSCAAIVHGKLGFEGKVIADVLETRYRIKLGFTFEGEERTDKRSITVIGYDPVTNEVLKHPITREPLEIKGTVSDWKTTGAGTPWNPPRYDMQLIYRGSREWARAYKSGAIMGTNSIDELMSMELENRAQNAVDKTSDLENRFKPVGDGRGNGFSPDNVKQLPDGRADAQLAGAVAPERPKETVSTGKDKPAEKEPAKQAQPAKTESAQEPVKRLERSLFEEFSVTLLRVSKAEAVDKMAGEFWTANGGWPPESPKDKALGVQIAKDHRNRAEGKVSLEDTKAHVAELIAESYGEGL